MSERNLYEVTGDIKDINTLLVPREQLEAMEGEQEPVQIDHIACIDGGELRYMTGRKAPAYDCELYAMPNGKRAAKLYAAPVAQQSQARPDFTDEWNGYLKDGETPFERFLRERKDLQSVLKLYQRVLEENERLKGQQPQAETDNHEAQGQLEFLDKKNNALSAAIRKVMARLADLLDEDQFKEIEEIVSFAGVQPQAEAVPWDRLPGHLIDKYEGEVLTEELLQTAVFEVLQAAPQQAEAVLSEGQIEVACEAVAGALGDAYDCTRVWSAWSYGTMGPEDFSQVSEDSDRVREIALAALGAAGLKVTP